MQNDPIFVHAWWRSASTYIWSKLRENASCRCYYEPLNERIGTLTLNEVTTPDVPVSLSLRHPAPEKSYYAEYGDLFHAGNLNYSMDLAYDRFLLRPAQSDSALRAYLEGLISSASAAERRPVLCFCRSQMRCAWMKQTLGGIHVAQIRNPVDQWASFHVGPYFIERLIALALRLRKLEPRAFTHIESFERIASEIDNKPSMEDFYLRFPSQDDVFALYLVIWFASVLQALSFCDFVLDVDLLSSDAKYRSKIAEWFGSIGCPVDFSDCSVPQMSDAPLPLIKRAVKEAARALRSTASPLIVSDSDAIEKRLPSLSPLSSRWLSMVIETLSRSKKTRPNVAVARRAR